MAQYASLMGLPDEILSEIIILVPYENPAWFNIRSVNRRFQRIASERSLETKVAKAQFYNLYHLRPNHDINHGTLYHYKIWSDAYLAVSRSLPTTTRRTRDLVELGILLARRISTRFDSATSESQLGEMLKRARNDLYLLRFLRLLPPGVKALIRYSVLKIYQAAYSQAVPSFLSEHPEATGYDSDVLLDMHDFLHFELHYIRTGNLDWSPPSPVHLRHDTELSPGPDTEKEALLIKRRGEFLPGAVMISVTIHRVICDPFEGATIIGAAMFRSMRHLLFYDVGMESDLQVDLTKTLCDRIEAEDGEYVDRLLEECDPKVLVPIMVEQERILDSMNPHDLYEALGDEIILLDQ